MSTFRTRLVVSVTSVALASASGQTVFSDDFESGLGDWVNVSPTYPITLSVDHNIAPPDGSQSMCIANSGSKTYHNLGSEVTGPSVATWYIYDDTQTRIFGEVRGYAGDGYAVGSLEGLYAAGKYTATTLSSDPWDATKYQGRFVLLATNAWFNLKAPGAPSRSPGWHRFDIHRSADGATVNFYVDGILGRSFTGLTDFSWDCVVFGLGSGATAGNTWVDGVSVSRETTTEATVALIKAVKPSFLNLRPTTAYQLQISADMTLWTNHGAPFTATNTTWTYPQYWDVDNWNSLFFRLQVVP
jgi:hypothetical protein